MRHNQRNKKGFTLTELLVLVAVCAILTGTLLASLSDDRQKMLQAACASNLKQWGMVFQLYADDFNGTIAIDMPNGAAGAWYRTAGPYGRYCGDKGVVNQRRILNMKMCPAQSLSPQVLALLNSGNPSPGGPADLITPGYEMIRLSPPTSNFRAWCLKNCTHPSSTAIMLDGNCASFLGFYGPNGSGSITDFSSATNRHFGGCNVLWADQHVTWESWDAIAAGCGFPPYAAPGQYWLWLVDYPCEPGSDCYNERFAMTSCQ
jgi:type II secretory pathway pseudopilin PulG